MTNYRNFPMVPRIIYGRESISQLDTIISTKRTSNGKMVFLVDHFFENNAEFLKQIPIKANDILEYIDVTYEPKTSYVDELRDNFVNKGTIDGVIGIGGGSVLDMAKAVALMITNEGPSSHYQGWDLIKNAGVYHVGIPTLSGTGAEVSRTAVLTGPTKKLGLNSDFTPFDQVVLDPNLIKDAPVNQRFYTAMDCYIHCIESLTGYFLNAFSRSYGEKALELCQDIYLKKDVWDNDSDEKLMMASWHGGMSIAYSQVGIAHALSYGLSFMLGTKHGIGNCIVFDHLEEYYPEGVREFKEMIKKHAIDLPKGITKGLTEEQWETMINVAYGMEPLWQNALGPDWKNIMTKEKIRALYEKM
jgi:3-deoxy-alpha-D-manno-octulosonate 8-oxidase